SVYNCSLFSLDTHFQIIKNAIKNNFELLKKPSKINHLDGFSIFDINIFFYSSSLIHKAHHKFKT
ncbi:MAG: hypothetical protein ACOCQO_02855, partial [Halanaerobiaceae bacterium]